jgi:hypothetical protein
MRGISVKKRLAVISAAVLLLLVGGIAYASIPAPDGVIHGCYKTSTPAQGALIAIDSAASCPSGYTALNWNQTGPQGPAGVNGTNGVSGYEVVAGSVVIVGPNNNGHASGTISCPSGKVALGSGWSTDVTNSQPTDDGTGWTYTFTIPSLGQNETYNFRESITCALVSLN